MKPAKFLNGRVTLHGGDSREVLASLPEASVDSIVTDPPYALTNRTPDVKWCVDCNRILGGSDGKPSKCPKCGGELEYQRSKGQRGFMGKEWDNGDTAFDPEFWTLALRVLKPGGHLVAFSGTRTYHRMACAIEDAGFEIRDQLQWLYGSGFPKSLDASKAIDKAAGAEREIIARCSSDGVQRKPRETQPGGGNRKENYTPSITAPATEPARQWQGWGTALKPACEPICLARKPLQGTVAENVLQHGTGAINIDGCRVEGKWSTWRRADETIAEGGTMAFSEQVHQRNPENALGRWPANIIHDGSEEVLAAFPEADGAVSNGRSGKQGLYEDGIGAAPQLPSYGDTGSAARFFYTAKADAEDRLGSKHPTVKPLDLMQYLVRLVTPKGGTVLDMFAGTGTTGEAAWREGMKAILIEREAEYQADIARRMELAEKPSKRAAVAATKNNLARPEDLPLFASLVEPAE